MRTTNLFIRAILWTLTACAFFSMSAIGQSVHTTARTDAAGQSAATARSRYIISARAGAINFVSGEAMWRHQGESDPRRLTTNDDLQSGDKIETGANGFVEMLLSPGTYLRIGANSSLELTNANLDDVRVTISKGSVIVEATGLGGAESSTRFDTPQTSVRIAQNGLYRINVAPQATDVFVRKGEARVGAEATAIVVRKNKKLTVGGASGVPSEVASFDKKSQDELDLLSKARAETLANVNLRLANNNVSYALTGYFNNNWLGFQSRFSPFGLWVYDPFYGYRTFLPFYDGWSSPYGFSYWSNLGMTFHRNPKRGFDFHTPHPPMHVASTGETRVNVYNTRPVINRSSTDMIDFKSRGTSHTMPVSSMPERSMPAHTTSPASTRIETIRRPN